MCAAFNPPTAPISGCFYGLNSNDRLEIKVPSIYNVDAEAVEPNIPTFGNEATVHQSVVSIGERDFLIYSWAVDRDGGVERNESLAKIRPSTIFFGEVLVFVKGTSARVPFLKNAFSVPKKLMEEAVGGYITALLNARDAGRVLPTQLKLSL